MPDFTNLKLVDKLLFHGCKSLLQVHPSIGKLTNLSHLDLGQCGHLKELIEPIAELTKLGHLDLRQCVNLKRLPELIIQLTTLGSLNLGHCHNLTRLPEQLGDMKCLKYLDASYTSIEQLPDSIGQLKELVDLKLFDCKKLRKLPDTFAGLVNLEQLHLRCCENLTSLPNSFWKLKVLQLLDLSYSSKLEQLPEQLGKMQCLKELRISGTSIEELPNSTVLLSRLQELNVLDCKKVKNLPSSIRNLTSLTKLYLDEKEGINLPDMVKDMKLKSLCLIFNTSSWLAVIPSFSSLVHLTLFDGCQIFSSTVEMLLDLSSMKNLKSLYINGGVSLQSLPPLPPNLEELHVYDCTSLQDQMIMKFSKILFLVVVEK